MRSTVCCSVLLLFFIPFASAPAFSGEPAVSLLSISDAPDPYSPPVRGQNTLTGELRFSGNGSDVNNQAITQRTLLRMTVTISTPGNAIVRTLSAETSASRSPGDPNEITKTLTMLWDGKTSDGNAVVDGLYGYSVTGALVRFHQNKQGQNTTPSETTLATSNTLTGSIFLDATAPVISNLVPGNGAFVSQKRPALSALFSDPAPASGVNPASARILLDGNDVTAQSAITAAGFSFTPGADLSEGAHTYFISIADLAGNPASATAAFSVDTVSPVISDLAPATGTLTNNPRPACSASFTDAAPSSGVDPASARIRLDEADVTAQATVTAAGFTFTPAANLSDGIHTLSVRIADRATNAATAQTVFSVDATPLSAPVVQYFNEDPDQVLASGLVPQDQGIAKFNVTVTSANTGNAADVHAAGSIVHTVFVVIFTAPGAPVASFTADLQFEDAAGNRSAATPVAYRFADNPGSGDSSNLPPAPPRLSNLRFDAATLTGDKTGTLDGIPVSYTKNSAVTVLVNVSTALGGLDSVTVTGGKDPVTLPGGGVSAGAFTFSVPLPDEGAFVFSASAVAKNGALTASGSLASTASKTLVADRTPPAVRLTTPLKWVTADIRCLILGPANKEVFTDPATQDPDALRNVFGANSFQPEAVVEDALSEPKELTANVREQTLGAEGLFQDFPADPDSAGAVKKSEQVQLQPAAVRSKTWRASAPGSLSAGLEEWSGPREPRLTGSNGVEVNPNNYRTYTDSEATWPLDTQYFTRTNKSYQLFLKATDAAGNEATRRVLSFVVDKTPLELRALRTWDPLVSVTTDVDAYELRQGSTRLRKEHLGTWLLNSVWRLAVPAGFSGGVTLYAEDLAGNLSSPGTVQGIQFSTYGLRYGNYEDFGRKRPMAGDQQLNFALDGNGEIYRYFTVAFDAGWGGQMAGSYWDYAAQTTRLHLFYDAATGKENKPRVYNPYLWNPDTNRYGMWENVTLYGPLLVHKPDDLFSTPVRLTLPRDDEMSGAPDRVPGRMHDFRIPRADGIPAAVFTTAALDRISIYFDWQRYQPLENLLQNVPSLHPPYVRSDWSAMRAALEADTRVKAPPLAAFVPAQNYFDARLVGIKRDWPPPGFSPFWVILDSQAGGGEVRVPGNNWFDSPGNFTENLNRLLVQPSAVTAGQRRVLEVWGAELAWGGEEVAAAGIKFKLGAQDVTAPVGTDPALALDKIVVHRAVGAHHNWRGLGGRVMQIGGGNHQRINLDVTIGPNVPVGLYDLTLTTPGGLNAVVLEKALNLIRIDLLRPSTANGAAPNDAVPTDLLAVSSPAPTVELQPPTDLTINATTGETIFTLSGVVRSVLADTTPGGLGDIPKVKVSINGEPETEIVLQKQAETPTLFRPYPFKGAFSESMSFQGRSGTNSVVVRTTPNLIGKEGSAGFQVDVKVQNNEPILDTSTATGQTTISLIFASAPTPDVVDSLILTTGTGPTGPTYQEDAANSNNFLLQPGNISSITAVKLIGTVALDPQVTDQLQVELTDVLQVKSTFTFSETAPDSKIFAFVFSAANSEIVIPKLVGQQATFSLGTISEVTATPTGSYMPFVVVVQDALRRPEDLSPTVNGRAYSARELTFSPPRTYVVDPNATDKPIVLTELDLKDVPDSQLTPEKLKKTEALKVKVGDALLARGSVVDIVPGHVVPGMTTTLTVTQTAIGEKLAYEKIVGINAGAGITVPAGEPQNTKDGATRLVTKKEIQVQAGAAKGGRDVVLDTGGAQFTLPGALTVHEIDVEAVNFFKAHTIMGNADNDATKEGYWRIGVPINNAPPGAALELFYKLDQNRQIIQKEQKDKWKRMQAIDSEWATRDFRRKITGDNTIAEGFDNPVAYTRGKKPAAIAYFKVDPPLPVGNTDLKAKGIWQVPNTANGTGVKFQGTMKRVGEQLINHVTEIMDSEDALESKVNVHNQKITWSVSTDNFQHETPLTTQTGPHKLYLFFADPIPLETDPGSSTFPGMGMLELVHGPEFVDAPEAGKKQQNLDLNVPTPARLKWIFEDAVTEAATGANISVSVGDTIKEKTDKQKIADILYQKVRKPSISLENTKTNAHQWVLLHREAGVTKYKGHCVDQAILHARALRMIGIDAAPIQVFGSSDTNCLDMERRTPTVPGTHVLEFVMMKFGGAGPLAGWNDGEGCCVLASSDPGDVAAGGGKGNQARTVPKKYATGRYYAHAVGSPIVEVSTGEARGDLGILKRMIDGNNSQQWWVKSVGFPPDFVTPQLEPNGRTNDGLKVPPQVPVP